MYIFNTWSDRLSVVQVRKSLTNTRFLSNFLRICNHIFFSLGSSWIAHIQQDSLVINCISIVPLHIVHSHLYALFASFVGRLEISQTNNVFVLRYPRHLLPISHLNTTSKYTVSRCAPFVLHVSHPLYSTSFVVFK